MSTIREARNLRTRDLCFLDVETTGPVFGFHEIIDIGAIRTPPDGSEIRNRWSCRIRPQHPGRITAIALQVNGFSEADWADARESSSALWSEFARFVEGCVPVCHNPSFDRAFITLAAAAVEIVDLGLDYHWIGTESLAWPFYLRGEVPAMSLDGLCDFLDVSREPRPHNALSGATACWKVYCALVEKHLARKTEVLDF